MFRLIPPAGIPVSFSDIIKVVWSRYSSLDKKSVFPDIVKNISRSKHCWFVNSGRAANFIILKSLRELSANAKNEVVIPAYTCFSVPASIAKAGLKIRLAEINPETLDYDYEILGKADFSKTLTILPVNLFGIVSDWTRLRQIAKNKNVYLIDDSAQTLGMTYSGIKCGSLGDVGFFSFGRGKNLTTYSGGAIVTNDDKIAACINSNIRGLLSMGVFKELIVLGEFIFYATMMRPWLYWIPDRLPFLGLGKTEYDEGFSVESLSRLQLAIGPVIYNKFDKIVQTRTDNSSKLAMKISALGNYIIPGWRAGANIPYIRLPILARNEVTRNKVIDKLRDMGIGASGMYPSTIREIPSVKKLLVNPDDNFPGAENVSRCLFTLPTHAYLKARDIENIIRCLKEVGQ